MKGPLDKAISDKFMPMHQKGTIPVTDHIGTGKAFVVELRQTQVSGVISWPKALGLPTGNLADAFLVLSYIYKPLPHDEQGPTAIHGMVIEFDKIIVAHIEEGPHDASAYRVTYVTSTQKVEWPPAYQRYQGASHNYLRAEIRNGVVWRETPASGPGPKAVWPTEAAFFHGLDGPLVGPAFRFRN